MNNYDKEDLIMADPDLLVTSLVNFEDKEYEAGGFVLERNGQYTFVKVPNKYHGSLVGRALYEPEGEVFAKMLGPYFRNKWNMYASMHSHPTFTSNYSGIDYRNLFQDFHINYIKSICYGDIQKYTWVDDDILEQERVT